MTRPPHIALLGAGPAGVAAAYRLATTRPASIDVFERAPRPGGNAASFQIDGVWCDIGSHRFHPVAEPHVLADVKALLGEDLLLRPRHGRIRLQKRWIHFPLKPADAMLRLPKPFAASLLADMVLKALPRPAPATRNFATVLKGGLGPTIARDFYFPYVKKLWGLEPEDLAVKLAERRVSGSSITKILRKMAKQIPGLGSETDGKFFYPRKGFGQIVTASEAAAKDRGARFHYDTKIVRIEREGMRVKALRIEREGREERIEADHIWSTIPLTTLVRLLDPAPPAEILASAQAMRFRGMILIYLVLEQDQFTEYDAHYFPELSIPISRMSEPKNYSAAREPKGTTVLCAELPCDPGQAYWNMSDEELGRLYCEWLAGVGLPVTAKVRRTETRRIGQAYPVYDLQYEDHFNRMDAWLGGLEGLLTFGRQGLFAHDNTHHAYAMAYGAVDCLTADATFDHGKWAEYREIFETHVVED
ncbi:MAG: FAD-dependent oxidoreductase [Alphaproteobacteria bacterium]|nr:FAD-dependent oxidoreductase [Alphaproteobacteria bacterium]